MSAVKRFDRIWKRHRRLIGWLTCRSYDNKLDLTWFRARLILYQKDSEFVFLLVFAQFHFDPADWGNISNDAKDLITKMLTLDPGKRITAEEALSHPWMEQVAVREKGAVQAPLLLTALGNMKKFQASQKLAQAALLFMGSKVRRPTHPSCCCLLVLTYEYVVHSSQLQRKLKS